MRVRTVTIAPATEDRANRSLAFRTGVARWAERINVSPRRVQVQRMTRKWASCSTAGTLTFSLDLLDEPATFSDYVIVHELLHLLVPNHGKVFRGLLRAYLHQNRMSRNHDGRLGCRAPDEAT
jgi:predicted metal-dependent hydrolase